MHHCAMHGPHRSSTSTLGVRYAASLALAQLVTAAEVLAIGWSLSSQDFGASRGLLTQANLVILGVVVSAGIFAAAIGGYALIAPTLRWFLAGVEPDERQRSGASKIVRNQLGALVAVWAVSGAVVLVANVDEGVTPALLICFVVAVGAASTASTSLLLTQRIFRQVASATKDESANRAFPGIVSRLTIMWAVTSALPCATIVTLVVCKSNGWVIDENASLDLPVLVLSVVACGLGLRALILAARSIADPVREVVGAMAEIEFGCDPRTVVVYDRSEIGKLQSGFNSMAAGLMERDRIRDVFGRHVGPAVVKRAIEGDDSLSGEVRDVAILFIDLAGSTQLAAALSPAEVVEILNEFFQIVVVAVEAREGLINQFQGDAALVVFGRSRSTPALATARALSGELRRLPIVDFGIGVSAGPVFAGNIGAENRHEFTVIGDAVNEAARLADAAKAMPGRVAASSAAIQRADDGEQRLWTPHGSVTLRGRADVTEVSVPRVKFASDDEVRAANDPASRPS